MDKTTSNTKMTIIIFLGIIAFIMLVDTILSKLN